MKETVDFSELSVSELLRDEGFACSCGKRHKTGVKDVIIGHGVLERIPELIKKHGGSKPFIIADQNTYKAAGERIAEILKDNGMKFTLYIFPQEHLEPDEFSVGQAAMNFDTDCNFIVGVGSGTLNDIGKILSRVTGLKYIIAGTAPSMDGYASNTSSMISAGIKVSLPSSCPVAIVADLDICCQAPMNMLQAGLGDMAAKYISICEWRISHLVNDEYYCENIAALVRRSLRKCIESAEGLSKRDPRAVADTIEGLILSGIAMGFAGISRPASGIEHYFSHIWEMRALEFDANYDLHGIQVGIGTILALKAYEQITGIKPDRKQALSYVERFNLNEHHSFLKEFLGSSANDLILLEKREGKYDREKHAMRLDRIISDWSSIIDIIREELPDRAEVEKLLKGIGAPVSPEALGFSCDLVKKTFHATKDIRDKYSISRLAWDLGVIDAIAGILC
ncbi:MAG TPA: sn-glycerol-1-phosphate dehydrogenase [Clostridiales bacterium]|nr:sn-glycerol-1-phosphate dehydrogenase [Clostridiales bacterium]